jgi:hypothetical protein
MLRRNKNDSDSSKETKSYIFRLLPLFSAAQTLKLAKDVLLGQMGSASQIQTSEAIRAKDYNVLQMLGASIPGFVLEAWLAHLQTTTEEEFDENAVKNLPNNAIVYAFHGDTLPLLLSSTFLSSLGAIWMGYHGLLSYVGSFGLSHKDLPCFRFNRKLKTPVLSQIESAMKSSPNKRFFIFTDSGQPYFRVRKSLVQMAKLMGRPLVPVRLFTSVGKKLNGHQIPLPGTVIRTVVGLPISAAELTSMGEAEALAILQQQIDALA